MSDPIQEQFEQFHLDNPKVYRELVRKAKALVKAGVDEFGIKVVYESLRYDGLVTQGAAFKLPNNFTSRYARLIQDKNPRLAKHIRTTSLRTASAGAV